MNLGRPLAPLQLEREQREQLEAMASSRSLPHGLVTRVRIILLSADGLSNKDIAARLRLNQVTVGLWRRRFVKQGLTGLHEELRSGRPRSIPDEKVATLIRRTLRSKPKDGTHWSCRSLAAETRLSKSTVHRIWRAFGLQPHRARHFQLSNDPFFVEKVRDIVGLYLNPPDKALVLCVDEKSQIQALERSQPMLPLGLGYVEGITHNYLRHGTTTLFAAFDPITGTVLSQCKRRHRHQEFLDFLRHVDVSVPKAFDVHLIVDNYATHKHPRVQRWLAARPPLLRALHAHLRFLAQPSGNLVQYHHPEGHPSGHLWQRQRTCCQNRILRPSLQCGGPTLLLDGHTRFNPRKNPATM